MSNGVYLDPRGMIVIIKKCYSNNTFLIEDGECFARLRLRNAKRFFANYFYIGELK